MADHTITANFEVKGGAETKKSTIILDIPQEVLRAAAIAIRDTPSCGDQAWYEANKLLRALTAAQMATELLRHAAPPPAKAYALPPEPSAVDKATDDVRNFGTGFVKTTRDDDGIIKTVHVPLDAVLDDTAANVTRLSGDDWQLYDVEIKPLATVADLRPTIEPATLVPPISDDGLAVMSISHPEGAPAPNDVNAVSVETVEAPDALAAQLAERAAQEAEIAKNLAAVSPLDAPQTGKGSRKAKVSRLDGQATEGSVSKLDAAPQPDAPGINDDRAALERKLAEQAHAAAVANGTN